MGQQVVTSRKKFRALVIPNVGDKLPNGDTIIYVHKTGMWFTAEGISSLGNNIELDERMFNVGLVKEGRYNCQFIGFKENPVAPVENTDDVAKVI